MSRPPSTVVVQRRTSMPQALEDPDDLTSLAEKDDFIVTKAPYSTDDNNYERAFHPVVTRPTMPIPVDHLPKELRNMIAGGLSGMLAKSVVAPFDRIKILYQISSVKFHLWSVPSVVRNIVRDEGVTALWKGNLATMIRVFPYAGIQFMTFDRVKSHFLRKHESLGVTTNKSGMVERNGHVLFKGGLTPLESLVAGMVAGTTSVVCTYPLDLTRAQLAVRRKHKHVRNLGFVGVLRQTYVLFGWRGLFRGISPTVLGILPYSGIAFSLNEQAKREVSVYASVKCVVAAKRCMM
ncbi:hypothetical protein MPSEU_000959900 [Mayamaea pseudoterrestris]|nr:hypothetical protein MPSEU_000959900 [Mayamaea pseudoterrestris]